MTRQGPPEGPSYTTVPRSDTSLAELHAARLAGIRDGSWPRWSEPEWRARADRARRSGDVSGRAVRAIETVKAFDKADQAAASGRGPRRRRSRRGAAA